jgi:NADH dehydrogenase
MTTERRNVFIAGGTGYIGQRLIPRLLKRGHEVRALVRPGSEGKLPEGSTPVMGSALDGASYARNIFPADTFVQLVGVAHPSPAKAGEFRKIDLPAEFESRRRCQVGRHTSFCLRERGASGAHDAGLHRSSDGV